MKKIILYSSFIVACFTTSVQAQETGDVESNKKTTQKIEALYVAFITREIDLTPEEAQKFWPVHAQYATELKAIQRETTTDELSKQQAVLNVKKKYQANFIKILGTDRCNNFYKKDAEFRRRMVERIKQIRQNGKERDATKRKEKREF